MASSLELKIDVLLDKRLIEFTFSLPPEEKIDNYYQKTLEKFC